jgi:hypothetical protein
VSLKSATPSFKCSIRAFMALFLSSVCIIGDGKKPVRINLR